MPTERKIQAVDEMRQWMEHCTIAVSTDYTGMSVGAMTDLRRTLREKGVQFRIIKNSLAHLAADAAGRPELKTIVEGPTGIAFGDGEPAALAKALADHIRAARAPMRITGGVLGDRTLTAQEVDTLATLPSREELVARLLGQMQAPITKLVYVLNAPIADLARVLQRHAENLAEAD